MMYDITYASHLLGEVGFTEVEYLCSGTSAMRVLMSWLLPTFSALSRSASFSPFFDTRTC